MNAIGYSYYMLLADLNDGHIWLILCDNSTENLARQPSKKKNLKHDPKTVIKQIYVDIFLNCHAPGMLSSVKPTTTWGPPVMVDYG